MQSRLFNTVITLNNHRAAFLVLLVAVVAVMAFVTPEVYAGLATAPNSCPAC